MALLRSRVLVAPDQVVEAILLRHIQADFFFGLEDVHEQHQHGGLQQRQEGSVEGDAKVGTELGQQVGILHIRSGSEIKSKRDANAGAKKPEGWY